MLSGDSKYMTVHVDGEGKENREMQQDVMGTLLILGRGGTVGGWDMGGWDGGRIGR